MMFIDGVHKFLNLALPKCLEEVKEPLEVSIQKRVEHIFVQKFRDVENVLA